MPSFMTYYRYRRFTNYALETTPVDLLPLKKAVGSISVKDGNAGIIYLYDNGMRRITKNDLV